MTDLRSGSDAGASNWKAWSLRPLVLFVAAYTIIGILHESAHALTAYALKVPSVLFHLYANIDQTHGTLNELAVIRAAGPVFCFGIGLICWLAYWKASGTRAELWLLYLGWFGVATLFGNLMSTAFVGDFSRLAQALRLPMSIRYGLSVMGALLLGGLAFLVGRELRKWAPAQVGGLKAMIGVIVVPVILGTALAILVFLPMPSQFVVGRIGESAFWIFAAVGTLLSRKRSQSIVSRSLSWVDLAILLLAVGAVRLLVGGIAFVP